MSTPIRLSSPLQLSQLLISRRRAHKLTQADVGRRLGLAQNRISQLEANPASLSADQLLRWLAALSLELQVTEALRTGASGQTNASGEVEW